MQSKITFFMIITDPDIVIADYAVKSYSKIRGLPFKLIIYSNWVRPELKDRYFKRWKKLSFVNIVENEWQDKTDKPNDPSWRGPFEPTEAILDRELRKYTTPYVATVDADFEILNDKFIPPMIERLDSNQNLIAISTNYSPRMDKVYDSYSDEFICGNERWHTWFCIYKHEALQTQISHAYYEEITEGSVARSVWDVSGYFQKALKDMGYELEVLDKKYRKCFIHYSAFSKNMHINRYNVFLYRFLQIIIKHDIFGKRYKHSRKIARYIDKILFGHIDRYRYPEHWNEAKKLNNKNKTKSSNRAI